MNTSLLLVVNQVWPGFARGGQPVARALVLAMCMTACSLRLPITPHNPILWSAGVAHLYCDGRGGNRYDGDVQRIVVLNHIVRIDMETWQVVKLQGSCKVTRH
jgi:hypothetical protein